MKKRRTLEDEIYDYLVPSNCNIVYQDSFFIASLVEKYGKEAVENEIKRQERMIGRNEKTY